MALETANKSQPQPEQLASTSMEVTVELPVELPSTRVDVVSFSEDEEDQAALYSSILKKVLEVVPYENNIDNLLSVEILGINPL